MVHLLIEFRQGNTIRIMPLSKWLAFTILSLLIAGWFVRQTNSLKSVQWRFSVVWWELCYHFWGMVAALTNPIIWQQVLQVEVRHD